MITLTPGRPATDIIVGDGHDDHAHGDDVSGAMRERGKDASMAARADGAFSPGDRVLHDVDEAGVTVQECGIVVHVWAADDLGGLEECYVAFFGPEFPQPGRRPAQPPHVLRYAASSLRHAPS